MCEKRCSQGLLARTLYTGFWGFCPGRSPTWLTESFCSDELNSHGWVLINPLLLPLPRVNCQSLICRILSDWLSITTGWHIRLPSHRLRSYCTVGFSSPNVQMHSQHLQSEYKTVIFETNPSVHTTVRRLVFFGAEGWHGFTWSFCAVFVYESIERNLCVWY